MTDKDLNKIVNDHWKDCRLFLDAYKQDTLMCMRKALILHDKQVKNLSLVKEIKTRKTNHMTALRNYQAGSEEAVNLKARISECQQIISIINDLNLTDVSESYSDNEVKWMLFYGKKSDDSKRIDDFGRIDLAISLMFENLEQTVIDKDAVEKIFWNRISLFLNSR